MAFASVLASTCGAQERFDKEEKVSVIAVLTGYLGSMPISTGEHISIFTPNPSSASGSFFLFSILTPAENKGQFFLIEEAIGPRVKDQTRLFKLGTRYRFKVSKAILFNPNDPSKRDIVDENVREAPVTKEEVDIFVESLNEEIAFYEKRIAECKKRLDMTSSEKKRDIFRNSLVADKANLLRRETLKKNAVVLLQTARDDFPKVLDMKEIALNEEGWKDVPRKTDIESEHQENDPKTKDGQQDGGGNALEPPSHPSTAPPKARATP